MTRPLNPFRSHWRVMTLLLVLPVSAGLFGLGVQLVNPAFRDGGQTAPPPPTITMTFVPGGTR